MEITDIRVRNVADTSEETLLPELALMPVYSGQGEDVPCPFLFFDDEDDEDEEDMGEEESFDDMDDDFEDDDFEDDDFEDEDDDYEDEEDDFDYEEDVDFDDDFDE
ncbi:hypothetical protein FACS189447_10460 [Spirochaetia bacterium]|nr:hypothetical protein FACS189447_10460 [Spirochaetia bacterium]